MTAIEKVLVRRDGLTKNEAKEVLAELLERVVAGEDPETLLREEVGLELDYFMDILP